MKTIVPLPVQIFYSCTLKFRHKVPATVALKKKSSRKIWNKQESKEAYHIIQGQTQFECCQIKCIRVSPTYKVPQKTLPSRNIPSSSRNMTSQKMKKFYHHEPLEKTSKEEFIRDEILNKEWVDSFTNAKQCVFVSGLLFEIEDLVVHKNLSGSIRVC